MTLLAAGNALNFPCAPWARLSASGAWCSGITSASHAEGPGFKSQCVQFLPGKPPARSSDGLHRTWSTGDNSTASCAKRTSANQLKHLTAHCSPPLRVTETPTYTGHDIGTASMRCRGAKLLKSASRFGLGLRGAPESPALAGARQGGGLNPQRCGQSRRAPRCATWFRAEVVGTGRRPC